MGESVKSISNSQHQLRFRRRVRSLGIVREELIIT